MMHHDKQSYYVRVYSTKKGRATDEERYSKNVLKLAGVKLTIDEILQGEYCTGVQL